MSANNNLWGLEIYKSNPDILQDIAYLKVNLLALYSEGLRFKDYPENIRKNSFFVLDYFSKLSVNKKEYAEIPQNLLKDQFFVNACISLNPDVYLLADPSCHTDYAFMSIKNCHPEKFLKYAKESNLNDSAFCKEALKISFTNFRYLPEKFKKDNNIIMETLKGVWYGDEHVHAQEVVKYLPGDMLKDREFVIKMLDCNLSSFQYLPKEYRKDFQIAEKVVCKDSSFFELVDVSLKDNKEFVNKLFEYKEKCEKQYSFRVLEKFKVEDILKELGESFLTRDFCEKHSDGFRNIYTEINKKLRGNLELIRCLYVFDPVKDKKTSLYESRFLSKIPNPELVEMMKNAYRCLPTDNFYKNAQENMLKLVEVYTLQKELKSSLQENEPKAKRIKI